MNYQELLKRNPLISDQVTADELAVVLRELEQVISKKVPGDIVEFGCYRGTTSLFLRRLLNEYNQSTQRTLHVYDSFSGLPNKTAPDISTVGEQFRAGELTATKQDFIKEFKHAGLQLPVIHKAWFSELTQQDVPQTIAFAYLDGDFYESILDSLQLVWPRLSAGGVITIDDYQRAALPGVERAVQVFFKNKQVRVQNQSTIAIIRAA